MKPKAYPLILLLIIAAVISSMVYPSLAKQNNKGNDRVLSKITFIHYKKGHAKPPWAGGSKPPKDDTPQGNYTYLAKGAKWKIIENLFLNPNCGENPDGSLDNLIINSTLAALDEWETPDNKNLTIFGDLFVDDSISYLDGNYRGYNTISFGPYSNPGVIAITTVWGYFTGPPSQREIVEAHILMNDDFVWGDAAPDSLLMDIQNIMTHEIGHWAGMGDLYETPDADETMYGYSNEGETKKRDLYYGDINGIIGLYK